MPRPRTTKGLAKRIELTYYKRLHPFRRWWRILCVAVPAAGALWLLTMAVLGDQRIYTSGSVVTAHAMFDAACERCHAEVPRPAPRATVADTQPSGATPMPAAHRRGGFFRRVSDGACLGCHDGAIHHDTQPFEPTCVTCHVEHQGRTTLARITDQHCTLCHADLKTKSGAPQFDRQVVSLAKHPELAVFRKNLKDEAQIKLSHETHLKPDLPAGGGKRVTLGCESCHREEAAGKYMLPIVYETHCAQCHPLEVGPDLVVPHEKPEIIRGFLLARLTGQGGGTAGAPAAQPEPPASEPPAEQEQGGRRRRGGAGAFLEELVIQVVQFRWGDPAPSGEAKPGLQLAQRQRGGAPPPTETEEQSPPTGRRRGGAEAPAATTEKAPAGPAPAATAPGGLAAVAPAERELFTGRQGCKYCHTLEGSERGLPKVIPPKIPDRWLPHSAFDHRAHRPLACVACHEGAPKSVETTDVLLPKLQVCRECHRARGGARDGCVECHIYHDRARERPADGPLTVPEFVSGRPRADTPPAKKTP